MTKWSKSELEAAFASYRTAADVGAESDDWSRFADHFTEDCVYLEHLIGTMRGREEVLAFYTKSMVEEYPGNCIAEFPIEWWVIDEDRGWVIFQAWSVMGDPGDGSVHRQYNISILHYAGDGKFSYQEDIYNPMEFGEMIGVWEARRNEISGAK